MRSTSWDVRSPASTIDGQDLRPDPAAISARAGSSAFAYFVAGDRGRPGIISSIRGDVERPGIDHRRRFPAAPEFSRSGAPPGCGITSCVCADGGFVQQRGQADHVHRLEHAEVERRAGPPSSASPRAAACDASAGPSAGRAACAGVSCRSISRCWNLVTANLSAGSSRSNFSCSKFVCVVAKTDSDSTCRLTSSPAYGSCAAAFSDRRRPDLQRDLARRLEHVERQAVLVQRRLIVVQRPAAVVQADAANRRFARLGAGELRRCRTARPARRRSTRDRAA